ncbi:UDP-N-acetylmuramoyl-L-alanine--D-glutamate ligase [Temperatibacter marinus]|uniref:UDP-N-acetylmuramoylalanine--D-glutamate ligase n=1 Tax=Temperatibacter marinus TaxID=1456591 RepID=A0AA52EA98_9PROT|nr:UDP-N-acetylmuramoyl-L-alanine--D-glutamate ligase [Temperatibacter marinus]WND01592.1 UDP-N-acetylmuramoyl-L-alanine--D-glutamate ligase [Temperatibacter marinus]
MIVPVTYEGKNVAVFGLARTGITAVNALRAAGAKVFAWDDDSARCAEVGSVAHNLYALDFKVLDYLMLAPGVPLTHPKPHALVEKAKRAGVPIMGDFDLFAAGQATLSAHKTVAITGTNGKSTTTALVTHMIREAGMPVAMGGNIGTGVLSLPALEKGGVYVLEMSSYQIDLTHHFKPDIAVLLNITPDHLDRHGDMSGYVLAKARLFELLHSDGLAVMSLDDSYSQSLAVTVGDKDGRLKTITVEEKEMKDGIRILDEILFEVKNNRPCVVGSVSKCQMLKGHHNWQNMATAYAIGLELGIRPEQILVSFRTFAGLSHRQEFVGKINGISFINDSKATNLVSALKALESFKNIHWIAGGRTKDEELTLSSVPFSHLKAGYFIGEAASFFVGEFDDLFPVSNQESLDQALRAAFEQADNGDVILLSPACSAFDQFKDFEERGASFKSTFHALKEEYAS